MSYVSVYNVYKFWMKYPWWRKKDFWTVSWLNDNEKDSFTGREYLFFKERKKEKERHETCWRMEFISQL